MRTAGFENLGKGEALRQRDTPHAGDGEPEGIATGRAGQSGRQTSSGGSKSAEPMRPTAVRITCGVLGVGLIGSADFDPPYSLPSTRSSTQQPRTCVASGPRRWFRMASLSQPASCRASARIGVRSNAFSS